MSIKIHPGFKINGFSSGEEDLKEIAYSLIKEGNKEEGIIGDFLLDWLSEEQSIRVSTSGSTGKPKLLDVEKEHMINSALATSEFLGLEAGDRALLCLSADYIAGKMMLVRSMTVGLDLDIVSPSKDPLEFVDKTYDFSAMVPLQAMASLSKLTQIKKLLIGGAPINSGLKEAISNTGIQNCFETYGMTETISHIALKQVSNSNKSESPRPFVLLPHISIRTDERNCLIINAPTLSKETIITNDVVELVSEKEFYWLGRYDNLINSGGVKLLPEQIEAKLASVLEKPFFISSLPDEALGEKVILVIEGKEDDACNESMARAQLDRYEQPKEIVFLTYFKRSNNGKILRQESLDVFLNSNN
ncbi:AMP-binding protein [Eudoraea chungangensis]|uniref:AMP-binding protein n=1 Tax=Eudoraea chungangensis TaxID=1481905 RepID=UPI0023EAFAF5|nr:AMP-binding protein [Eudoraea chungangensis]